MYIKILCACLIFPLIFFFFFAFETFFYFSNVWNNEKIHLKNFFWLAKEYNILCKYLYNIFTSKFFFFFIYKQFFLNLIIYFPICPKLITKYSLFYFIFKLQKNMYTIPSVLSGILKRKKKTLRKLYFLKFYKYLFVHRQKFLC